MSEEIKADYEQLQDIATQFANQANEIEQMIRKYYASYTDLRDGGWLGRGRDAFVAEMDDEVHPASGRFYQALREANKVTKDIINQIRQSEEEAASLFKSS
ncbi:MAG: WXG100 family type VII secretion target [Anaerolineae bacterium]|nr:WXG100 family type VII secretion target [Anaerolineae bacterium]